MQSVQSADQTVISRKNIPGIYLSWGRLSILAALAIGAGLRVYFYLLNRSLWFDEAMLALNLVARDFAGLLQPLDYTQGAPIGFLLLQKAVISLFGNHDYVLRLFPLFCGLTSLPLFYLVVRQHLIIQAGDKENLGGRQETTGVRQETTGGRQATTGERQEATSGRQANTIERQISPGGQLAIWLFALSPQLIYYSSECKQYAGDVLIAVLLYWLAGDYLNGQNKDRALLITGLTGALALWFSHPALFVLGGIFLSMGIDCLAKRDWPRLLKLLALGVVAAVSLGLNYLVSLQQLAANPHLSTYWETAFAPLPPWEDWGWYTQVWFKILERPLKLPVNTLSLLVLALGLFTVTLRRWQTGLALAGSVLLTLAASALQKYPFGERMLLFLVPFFLLLLTAGIDGLRQFVRRWQPWLVWLVFLGPAAYFLLAYVNAGIQDLPSAAKNEHIKPLLVHFQQQARPKDRLYVYYGSRPAFLYYAPQLGIDHENTFIGKSNRSNPEAYLQEIETFATGSRVWVLFTHICSWCQVHEEMYILDYLDQAGKQKEALTGVNASLYLYDLR